ARRVRAGAAPGPGDALAYAARGSSPGPRARCRISGAARGARRDRVARRPARRASPADAQRRPGHAALRRRARAQVPHARIDHACFMTPDVSVELSIEECGSRGVPVATIFSDGFADAGDEGTARQARLVARARTLGVRVLGPNSMGLVDVPGRVALTVNAVLE